METSVKCDCLTLPTAVNLESAMSERLNHLDKIDEKPFLSLHKCRGCGQLWQLDQIDRLQTNLAIKLQNVYDWNDFDDTTARVQFLIDSRGGLSDKTCIKHSCSNLALRTLAYCPEHAYFYAGLRQ
jgi:hypothetical protein